MEDTQNQDTPVDALDEEAELAIADLRAFVEKYSTFAADSRALAIQFAASNRPTSLLRAMSDCMNAMDFAISQEKADVLHELRAALPPVEPAPEPEPEPETDSEAG